LSTWITGQALMSCMPGSDDDWWYTSWLIPTRMHGRYNTLNNACMVNFSLTWWRRSTQLCTPIYTPPAVSSPPDELSDR
jgi:hypothetical protein